MKNSTNASTLREMGYVKHFTQYRAYPWVILVLCSSLLFYKYVLNVSPSIMTHELMSYFHLTAAQLGNLAATFFYTYTIVQLFVGVVLDKWGVRFLGGFAVLISAVGAYLFSVADSLWLASIGRGMMGFGVAFATVVYLKTTTLWFSKKHAALISGLLPTAVMLGAVFGEAPLAALVDKAGWQHTLWLCSVVGLCIACLFWLLVRDQTSQENNTGVAATAETSFLNNVSVVLRNSRNWLLTLYAGLAFIPLAVFAGLWGTPFLKEAYHLSRVNTATLVSVMFVGLGLGGPLFGWLSDVLQRRRVVMAWGLCLSLLALLGVLYSENLPLWVLSSLLFLFGAGTGAFMLCFTLGREGNPLAVTATVIALINSGDLIGAFTEPMIGKFLDLGWNGTMVDGARHFTLANYHYAFLPLPLYLLGALVLLIFIRDTKRSDASQGCTKNR